MESKRNDEEVVLIITADGKLSKKIRRTNQRNNGPKILWFGREKFSDTRNYTEWTHLNVSYVIVSDDQFGNEAKETLRELIKRGQFPHVPIQKVSQMVRLGNVI